MSLRSSSLILSKVQYCLLQRTVLSPTESSHVLSIQKSVAYYLVSVDVVTWQKGLTG